jgi:putative Holliday junction resolvase
VRALGIDYGARRIGLALSDATGLLASPWKTIANDGTVGAVVQRLQLEIDHLIAESDGLETVVVGLPRRLNGDDTHMTPEVRALAARLAKETPVTVSLQDERLSSHEAETRLAGRERDWRKRKRQLDAMAAAVILQDFLDGRRRS